ncbi:MAG: hypothetical protein PHV82_04865 [Victivallaceae bacterium]|nr:hypothetical protein [Victivallaceae bacterium]
MKNNYQNSGNKIVSIENEIILHGRRNNQAWFAPILGAVPPGNGEEYPELVLFVTQLTANDVGPGHFLLSPDLGKTWSPPMESQNLFKVPLNDNLFEAFGWSGGGLGLFYHRRTGTLLGIGLTIFLRDGGDSSGLKAEQYVHNDPKLKRVMAYTVWNAQKKDFQPWKKVKFPETVSKIKNIRPQGCSQMHECDNGTILIPSICQENGNSYSQVTVIRCSFDGSELKYIEHGTIHELEEGGGLHEPSMIYFQGRYFMTIRGSLRGYVSSSSDGLNFNELKAWRFDDGSELGSYCTQQHWLKHNNTLYLVYTRKNELSNGVFRDRAPLFMAEVNPDTLQVRRAAERIVFPEKGARMGNFCTAEVSPDESWILTGEWLQGTFPVSPDRERFRVDKQSYNYIQYIGDLLLARIHWEKQEYKF